MKQTFTIKPKYTYRGYQAYVTYDPDDQEDGKLYYHGSIADIGDIVDFTFEPSEFKKVFHKTVDAYIEFCRDLGLIPETPRK